MYYFLSAPTWAVMQLGCGGSREEAHFVGGYRGFGSSYQLLGELGRGGVAEVFLARRMLAHDHSPFADNFVALKRLQSELASHPVRRQMLVEEARLGAGFNHPNPVEVYDLGEHGGHDFFTMELVRGHELRHLVRAAAKVEGRLALPHVLTIIGSIAAPKVPKAPNITAPMPVLSKRPMMPAGPVQPMTTAPNSTVPEGSGEDVATELARRYQPISRRRRA